MNTTTRAMMMGLVTLTMVGGMGGVGVGVGVGMGWGRIDGWSAAPRAVGQPPAKAQEQGEEADEKVINLSDLPGPVREAALKLAGDAKNITKVIQEEDDEDVVTFEVEYLDAGVKCSAVFAPSGEVMEQERSIPDAKIPAAALAALKKEYPQATFGSAEVVVKTYYEVVVTEGTTSHSVKVNAAGAIEDEQADEAGDEEDEQPAKGGVRGVPPGQDGWRASFDVKKTDLANTGAGTYFMLQPGRVMRYAGGDVTLAVTVLDETRVIDGVATRVIEERESKGGVLVEVSRNYFAIEPRSGDVYYFGEEVDIYKDGKIANHEGAWLSGEKGARFGLFIPGAPKLGEKFYQEVAPGEALDRFEVVSVSEQMETPAGKFEKVVKTEETTPLEPGKSHKWFAPGVGMIRDGELVLTKIETAAPKK